MVTIGVTPSNITQGPAAVYIAPFGTTVPLDSAVTSPPGANWIDIGGTTGGVNLEVDNTYTPQDVDQLVDSVGARLTKRSIMVTTSMAETSLANMQYALNNLCTFGVQTGYTTTDLLTATSATQPAYATIIIDGWAPVTGTSEVSCRRRIVLWKTISQSKLALDYEMAKYATFAISWQTFYVSASVSPMHITDQTS